MSSTTPVYRPLVHRIAVATLCAALLPIAAGALVTTRGAGMAFADWPSSDGHNMFFYPWLQSAGDKFIEHGHRLAGALIGMLSILLAAVLWRKEPRRWVKAAGILILLGVVAQGILGGMRVLGVNTTLAWLHGAFAAVVFSLMGAVALFTSRRWVDPPRQPGDQDVAYLKPWAVSMPVVIFGQYLLGGQLRHLGRALHEHIALGVIVLLFVAALAVITHRCGVGWLRRAAWLLLAVIVVQFGLGLGAFATKFGFAPTGYVAVQDSAGQVLFRTAHMVLGVLTLMISVTFCLKVFRTQAVRGAAQESQQFTQPAAALAAKGGSR